MLLEFLGLDDTILGEPGKTDELLANLEAERQKLMDQHAASVEKGLMLSEVVSHLNLMEEKTIFFAEMVDKIQGEFVPPPAGDTEVGMLAIQQHVFGNISKLSMVSGLLAAPLVVDIAFRVGKYAGKISDVGRVARVMEGTRYAKVMKFARGAAALAVAVEMASFVMNMVASQKMNEGLRDELADLKAKTAKGLKDFNVLAAALDDAINQREEMLAQAGVETPEEYVRVINEALAEMGRKKASFETARRMILHKMPDDLILSMVEGIDADALSSLKTRLKAEVALAAGGDPAKVAADVGLDAGQVAEIAVVVEARNALVRGRTREEVAETISIGPGLLDDVDDMLDEALPDHWAEIEGVDPLAPLAAKLILAEAALIALRTELKAKSLLSAGTDVGVISESLALPRDTVVAWASAIPLATEAARNQRVEGIDQPAELAAANRLPLALVAA